MSYYGPDQAQIHHTRFGDLAADAACLLIERLDAVGLTDGHVMDLGCGSGILAAALIAAGYEVTGVDISSAMIDLARVSAPGGSFTVGSVHDAVLAPSVGVTATEAGPSLDRRIVILVREPDGRYRRVDEHHQLVLYAVPDGVAALESAGFAVEVRPSYTAATASTPAAGWAVFAATRPR